MATSSVSGKVDPIVRKIEVSDIFEALAQGLRDFQKAPTVGLILGAICAAVGAGVVWLLYAAEMAYFAYPLAAGFAIICPFLAAGIYEVSRRLETGEEISFGSVWSRVIGRSEIRWMGFVTVFIYVMWMYQIRFLLAVFLGYTSISASFTEFLEVVFTTTEGWTFLLVGNLVGMILSAILFTVSVVSFPIVLDRDTDFVTAMITSIRSVGENPFPMLVWGAIIVALLVVSALPAFLGLLIVMPILGHATWHVYRKVVEPAPASEAVTNGDGAPEPAKG